MLIPANGSGWASLWKQKLKSNPPSRALRGFGSAYLAWACALRRPCDVPNRCRYWLGEDLAKKHRFGSDRYDGRAGVASVGLLEKAHRPKVAVAKSRLLKSSLQERQTRIAKARTRFVDNTTPGGTCGCNPSIGPVFSILHQINKDTAAQRAHLALLTIVIRPPVNRGLLEAGVRGHGCGPFCGCFLGMTC
jgi:hypothetical protein